MEKSNYEMQMKLLFVKEILLLPLYRQQKNETTAAVPPVI